jgi:hypothetical protein
MASSTVAYADAPEGVDNLIVETAAPEVESMAIEPVEEPADMQEAAPTFDDLDQSEEADVSDENVADYITDESVDIASSESVDIAFHSESISDEELVGAVTYRSIYEPCFSKVRQLNRQKADEVGAFHYEYYSYTLLDLNYDGIKELIVNASWNKHAHTYYIYTINSGSKASLIGKVFNDCPDPIMTNGSRIAFFETYKGRCGFYSAPFNGTHDYDDLKILYQGAYTYSSTITALKDLTRKKFSANAVMSPEFISISDLSMLNGAGNVTRFTDVIPNQTLHAKEVYWAAAKGITKGYTGTNLFGVEDTCTRGEAAMFLWRLAGKPAPKSVSTPPFSDVPKSHVFYNAILWAHQKGIAKGYSNGKFDVDGKCTRGQIATFIWRYKGSPKPKSSVSPFKDALTPAYKTAIIWAAEKGITKVFSDNTFRDKQYCTRGEIVTFLYRVK